MSVTAFTSDEQTAIQEKGFVWRMVCFPAASFGLWALAWNWPSDALVSRVVMTCFTAYFMFCWTSCFHETAHQTLTRWRWLDILIGRALGTAVYVPYTVYRESHIRHHAYVNRPNDWELWPYSNPNCSRTFRQVFVLFDILFGFVVAPFIYGRLYFHRNSPLKNPEARRAIAFEYGLIVLFWGFVLYRTASTNSWLHFIQVWMIPHLLAGILQTMRKLTEHLGMSSYDPMLGTRTVIGDNWVTRLGSFVNFDIFIHGPHHRHPRLAQNLLRGKMDEYLATNPDTNYPVYTSYWRATAVMLPFLFQNPGIGVNVGAAPPAEAREKEITNFVADVTLEVH